MHLERHADGVIWQHGLPCQPPAVVARRLPEWLRGLAACPSAEALQGLRARWEQGPRWLAPLAEVLGRYAHPMLVGGYGEAWLQLGRAPLADLPWAQRPWGGPWEVLDERVRRYLLEAGVSADALERMSNSERTSEAEELWHAARCAFRRAEEASDDGDEEPDLVFLPDPGPRAEVERALGERSAPRDLVDFYAAFGALRESEPGTAGAFVAPGALAPLSALEERLPGSLAPPAWRRALILFEARNWDCVVLEPEGRTAWRRFVDGQILPIADDLPGFVRAYAAALARSWPFDSYGPPAA